MQGYSTPSLLYDEGFFGKSDLNFNDNGGGGLAEATISSGLLGLSDSLDRLDTSSSFCGSLQAMGDPAATDVNRLGGSHHSDRISDTHVHGVVDHHHGQQTSHLLDHQHQSDNNSFGLDDNGNLVMRDMIHQHHIINPNNIHGVTTQWEESLQDLQSLLAIHGQHPQMNLAVPMSADPTAFNNSSNLNNIRGHYNAAGHGSGLEPSGGKFPGGDSELLSLLHPFPRPSSSSSMQLQQQLQGPAGPVSAFPSNPGFRKGGGPVNSASNAHNSISPGGGLGLYSASLGSTPQNSLTAFPYAPPSLVGSSYFNVNPGGNNNFNAGKTSMQQLLQGVPSILDLEQGRGRCSEENNAGATAAKYSSSLFELAKRGSGGRESTTTNLLLSGKSGSEPRSINHFATERQRREYLNEKYQTLRSLVPNPSKADRASIVADAIEYVKELKSTVQELQLLVQEKRREKTLKGVSQQFGSGHKRRREDDDIMNAEAVVGGGAGSSCGPGKTLGRTFSKGGGDPLSDASLLRTSWLQRTSQKGTHVDVRIVHDEVSIKLTQRRRKGCLLQVMVTLQELRLDLQHANGATIGEHDVYIFNTKILEGSSTFAGYVVTKLLEAVDHV